MLPLLVRRRTPRSGAASTAPYLLPRRTLSRMTVTFFSSAAFRRACERYPALKALGADCWSAAALAASFPQQQLLGVASVQR